MPASPGKGKSTNAGSTAAATEKGDPNHQKDATPGTLIGARTQPKPEFTESVDPSWAGPHEPKKLEDISSTTDHEIRTYIMYIFCIHNCACLVFIELLREKFFMRPL